jgi:hypothetical protein
MNRRRTWTASLVVALALICPTAWARIPPPPPLDDKGKAAAEDKRAKAAEAAEAAKKALADAQDRAVKNYRTHAQKARKRDAR